jgi:hypothetical protein
MDSLVIRLAFKIWCEFGFCWWNLDWFEHHLFDFWAFWVICAVVGNVAVGTSNVIAFKVGV